MNFGKNKATTSSTAKPIQQAAVKRNIGLLAGITPIGLEFGRNTIRIGENYCRIYTVIQYPNSVDYCWLSHITNFAGTVVSIGGEPIDNTIFTSTMANAIKEAETGAAGAKDALERSRKERVASDAAKIMVQIDQNNEDVGGFSMEIMVLSRDENDFDEKCARVESACNANGIRIRTISNLQQEAYKHLSPMYPLQETVSEIALRPFLLSTFTGGFPYAASGFCDPTGYYLAKNADNGIILFDPWIRNSSRTNSNITILGDPGMGKSTALKHIILSEIARGTKVIIIDHEGEYKEICLSEYVNGKWIDVSGGRGGIINPFHIRPTPKDDDEKEDERGDDDFKATLAVHLKMLETFFSLYLPSLRENDISKALLNQSILDLYEKFNINWTTDISTLKNSDFPTMADLVKLLSAKAEKEGEYQKQYRDLALLLQSAATGADQFIWNGHTNIDSDCCCVCLDTKMMSNMGANVLSAQYFNILSWCWQEMSCDKTERVMLVCDECWILADPNCPQSLQFLKNAEKRARKYEGSIVVSSQSINDFIAPEVKYNGQAVLDSPNIKILFGMNAKGLQDAREVFVLNDAQYDLIAEQRRGVALMRVGSKAAKAVFEFSSERLKMFGSGGGR